MDESWTLKFGRNMIRTPEDQTDYSPAANSRFAKVWGGCFYDSEVLNSSFVYLIKFSAEKPRLRKAAKR